MLALKNCQLLPLAAVHCNKNVSFFDEKQRYILSKKGEKAEDNLGRKCDGN